MLLCYYLTPVDERTREDFLAEAITIIIAVDQALDNITDEYLEEYEDDEARAYMDPDQR